MKNLPFNRALYTKVLVGTALLVAVIFTIAILGFQYELTNADVPGSLVAIPLAAYLFHLWIGEW